MIDPGKVVASLVHNYGLPQKFAKHAKDLRVWDFNIFDTQNYFPMLEEAGGIDVLYIKDLIVWLSEYESYLLR